MRAYLIAQVGAEPGIGTADAVVVDGRDVLSSLRAGGEATQGQTRDIRDLALGCFASRAMTEGGGAVRRLLRIDGIDMPDLDACLAATAAFQLDAIVLPARDGRDVAHLGSLLAVHEAEHGLPDGGIGIVAIVSCPAGVLAAASFVGASPRLRGLGWDAEALARHLGMPGGARGGANDPWGSSPVLSHARAVARLAAAAAGIEAIEAAYPGDDAAAFGAHVAAARRDGFGAMFVRDPAQAQHVRSGA